jgi:hypothetical protein
MDLLGHGHLARPAQLMAKSDPGYFGLVTSAITPDASTVALAGSTESEQFAAAQLRLP